MNDIQLGQDILDSREIISRIDELERNIESWQEGIDDNENAMRHLEGTRNGEMSSEYDALVQENKSLQEDIDGFEEELALWREFEDAGVADWHHGEVFIHDDYFEQYAEEMAYDIGAVDRDASWPFSWPLNRIDWEKAADDLKIDYTEVDVDGHTYWVRA